MHGGGLGDAGPRSMPSMRSWLCLGAGGRLGEAGHAISPHRASPGSVTSFALALLLRRWCGHAVTYLMRHSVRAGLPPSGYSTLPLLAY